MARKKAEKGAKPEAEKPRGRPNKFTVEIGQEICSRIAAGESLRAICRNQGEEFPAQATVHLWIFEAQKEGCDPDLKLFAEQYAQARKIQAEGFIDEVLDIADDGSNDWMEKFNEKGEAIGWKLNGEHVQRSRVRIDSRKWIASKVLPKIYGDKIIHDIDKLNLPEIGIRVMPSTTKDEPESE